MTRHMRNLTILIAALTVLNVVLVVVAIAM